MGKYHLIQEYYQKLGNGGVNLSHYDAEQLSLEEVYTKAAHQLYDMIVRYVPFYCLLREKRFNTGGDGKT